MKTAAAGGILFWNRWQDIKILWNVLKITDRVDPWGASFTQHHIPHSLINNSAGYWPACLLDHSSSYASDWREEVWWCCTEPTAVLIVSHSHTKQGLDPDSPASLSPCDWPSPLWSSSRVFNFIMLTDRTKNPLSYEAHQSLQSHQKQLCSLVFFASSLASALQLAHIK